MGIFPYILSSPLPSLSAIFSIKLTLFCVCVCVYVLLSQQLDTEAADILNDLQGKLNSVVDNLSATFVKR